MCVANTDGLASDCPVQQLDSIYRHWVPTAIVAIEGIHNDNTGNYRRTTCEAAIVKDGQLVAAVNEERLWRDRVTKVSDVETTMELNPCQ